MAGASPLTMVRGWFASNVGEVDCFPIEGWCFQLVWVSSASLYVPFCFIIVLYLTYCLIVPISLYVFILFYNIYAQLLSV